MTSKESCELRGGNATGGFDVMNKFEPEALYRVDTILERPLATVLCRHYTGVKGEDNTATPQRILYSPGSELQYPIDPNPSTPSTCWGTHEPARLHVDAIIVPAVKHDERADQRSPIISQQIVSSPLLQASSQHITTTRSILVSPPGACP